jgi:hypothetical protein
VEVFHVEQGVVGVDKRVRFITNLITTCTTVDADENGSMVGVSHAGKGWKGADGDFCGGKFREEGGKTLTEMEQMWYSVGA